MMKTCDSLLGETADKYSYKARWRLRRKDVCEKCPAVLLNEIARKCREIGSYEDALQAAGTIADYALKAIATSDTAGGYIKNDHLKNKAVDILSQALEIAKSTHITSQALPQIADKYLDVGELDKARNILGCSSFRRHS